MIFRNGQWVKFLADINGTHVTDDGLKVGIFMRGGMDSFGNILNDRIIVVDSNGHNVLTVRDGIAVPLTLDPIDVLELQPILSRNDIPPARLLNNPDWNPRP